MGPFGGANPIQSQESRSLVWPRMRLVKAERPRLLGWVTDRIVAHEWIRLEPGQLSSVVERHPAQQRFHKTVNHQPRPVVTPGLIDACCQNGQHDLIQPNCWDLPHVAEVNDLYLGRK